MSAFKRAVAQKTALQQAEAVAVAPIAVEAIPTVEKVLPAVQAAEGKVEEAQDAVTAVQESLPLDLAQMAEEFHAESVAFANDNASGEILLAQANQGKKDDGAAAAATDDDGGLGAGGWAALIGLGVIAAAGGGGGGDGTSTYVPPTASVNLTQEDLVNIEPIGSSGKFRLDLAGVNTDEVVATKILVNVEGINLKTEGSYLAQTQNSGQFTNEVDLLADGEFSLVYGGYDGSGADNDLLIFWNDNDVGSSQYYGGMLLNLTSATTQVVVDEVVFNLSWSGGSITSITPA